MSEAIAESLTVEPWLATATYDSGTDRALVYENSLRDLTPNELPSLGFLQGDSSCTARAVTSQDSHSILLTHDFNITLVTLGLHGALLAIVLGSAFELEIVAYAGAAVAILSLLHCPSRE